MRVKKLYFFFLVAIMWRYNALLMSLLVHQAINGLGTENKRHKRYLLFTTDTQWGVFVTVAIPLHPETTVSVAWYLEANYYSVDNATYFEPLLGDITTLGRTKQERSVPNGFLTRKLLYTFIETMLEKHGYPGHFCLLRAICENTTTHFLHNGVLGDLIHLMLTPSASLPEEDLEDCYYEAEYLGLEKQCHYYSDYCLKSPVDMFSIHVDDLL